MKKKAGRSLREAVEGRPHAPPASVETSRGTAMGDARMKGGKAKQKAKK